MRFVLQYFSAWGETFVREKQHIIQKTKKISIQLHNTLLTASYSEGTTLLRKPSFRFQKTKQETAETGQSWWVASSILCTNLLPAALGSRCQIKMHHVEWALVGWSVARYVSEISRVTGVVRYVYVSEISRVRGMPTLPQTSTLVGLPVQSQITRNTRLGFCVLLGCQMYATVGEMWAQKGATQRGLS